MVDVLLIQPPIRDFYLTAGRTIPYGLACIASALLEEGFTVQILDCLATSRSQVIDVPPEMAYLREFYGKPDLSPFGLFHHFKHYGYSFERIGQVARQSDAFLVGISSLFTAYSGEALRTAETVKAFHPGCKVVLGGHHPTELPEETMRCQAVDYVLRGEGEVSMPKLAKALKEGTDLQCVPGIVFRGSGKTVKISPPAAMLEMETYPAAALNLVNNHFYRRAKKGSAVVVASRGCPMKCTYCSVSALSHVAYRRRSVKSVVREIEEGVLTRGVRFIDFEDENISLEKGWFLDLLAQIKARFGGFGLELRAMNGLYAPSLDREVVTAMREAGFRTINLSLGTTSIIQQRRFGRPDMRSSFEKVLGCANSQGLQVVSYIVVGAPGQDPSESIADLLYLAGKPVLVGVSVYYPSPGSVDYRRCVEDGILPESLSLMRATAIPISHTTNRLESITLLRLGRIINYMKLLLDEGEALPGPVSFDKGGIGVSVDRREAGRALLGWFLQDGIIRGITPEGEIFEHSTSPEMTERFLAGLSNIEPRGWAQCSRRNPAGESKLS